MNQKKRNIENLKLSKYLKLDKMKVLYSKAIQFLEQDIYP
jgi:hypothetical protein